MCKISVILPNYNHSTYLGLRLDSIVNQTYDDFELIILDDCSTDNSREIIEKYRPHPKVSAVVFNEKNSGSTFIQWEKGITMAKGKYIWIAESDDFAEHTFIAEMIRGIEDNPGVGLAFCASNITDSGNKVSSRNYNYNEAVNLLLSDNFVMNGKEFCERHLFYGCVLVNASAVVFEKKLYQSISDEYKKFKVSGDWRMWTDICYGTNIFYLNKSLNYFRFHTDNVRTKRETAMNGEAILNFISSYKKTDSKSVKEILKDKMFKHWCFEFSRGIKKFSFRSSVRFMNAIRKVDNYFYLKLVKHVTGRLFGVSKETN